MKTKEEVLRAYNSENLNGEYTTLKMLLIEISGKLENEGISGADSLEGEDYDEIDVSYNEANETFHLEYEYSSYSRCGDSEYYSYECYIPMALILDKTYIKVMVAEDSERKRLLEIENEKRRQKAIKEQKIREISSDREKIRALIKKYPELKHNILALEKLNKTN
ncbi:MAG: hypothetical protein NUV97_03500 [archaeon]|nr:hypothetical protein [archaeon]